MAILQQFQAELGRAWIQFKRYPAESIGGIFITTSIFYGLFLSAKYIAGPTLQFGDRLDSVIVGYVLWSLVLFVGASIVGTLQDEAQTGTLEQLFLSSMGARRVFLLRAIASLCIQLILITIILTFIMVLTGRYLTFTPAVLPALAVVLLPAYGLAFFMGSIALLFKRVQQFLGILQFGYLFLLTAPTEEWTGTGKIVGWLLPMSPGAGLLRSLMAKNLPWDWGQFSIALLNGLGYFAIGWTTFYIAERETKRRGRLGGY